MTTRPANAPQMFSVFADGRCLGFVMCRGPCGHEAFDRDQKSLGVFETSREAATAIMTVQS